MEPKKILVNLYAVKNGLIGANRDVLFKLMRVMRNTDKIRCIIGLCELSYSWKNNGKFCWVCNNIIPKMVCFPDKENRILVKENRTVVVSVKEHAFIAIDELIDRPIVMRLDCMFPDPKSIFSLGIIACTPNNPYGDLSNLGTQAEYSQLGHVDQVTPECGNNEISHQDLVGMEVDIQNRRLDFYLNNIRQPVALSGIPRSLKFKVWLAGKDMTFRLLSFRRVPRPSYTTARVADVNTRLKPGVQARLVPWKDR